MCRVVFLAEMAVVIGYGQWLQYLCFHSKKENAEHCLVVNARAACSLKKNLNLRWNRSKLDMQYFETDFSHKTHILW